MLNDILNFVVLALTLNFEKNKTPVPHGSMETIFYLFMYSWAVFTVSYLIYRYYYRGISEKERHQKLRIFLKKYKIVS
jgi:Kef-type K+ transport system membrane component KefB